MALYDFELGRLDSAKTEAEQDLGLSDNNASAWFLLAKIYQINGQREKVIFALGKAAALRPDLPQLGYVFRLAKKTPDIRLVPITILVQPPPFD